MAEQHTSEDSETRVRVLVELRVPADDSGAAAMSSAVAMAVRGFEVDRMYEPIHTNPPPEMAASMEAAHETLMLVRGTVEESRIPELEADDRAVRVWRDTPVEPF